MFPALADIMPLTDNSKRLSVVRSLFGKPDRESTSAELERQESLLKDDLTRFAKKWGYDPVEDKIVPGSEYLCENFGPNEYIPSFYTRGYSSRMRKPVMDNQRRLARSVIRPCAAKRKLNLCDDQFENIENDENSDITATTRVPCKGQSVDCMSDARSTDSEDSVSTASVLCGSELPLGLTDCPNSETAEIARREFTTPPTVQWSQKTILDYLPVKKRRMSCQKNSQHTS